MAAELTGARQPGDKPAILEPAEDAHVLVLGGEVFTCADSMPFGTLMKYADREADLVTLHFLLTKLVHPDHHDRMWDAFDQVGIDEGSAAIGRVMESYTKGGGEPVSPSSAGSKRTKRR